MDKSNEKSSQFQSTIIVSVSILVAGLIVGGAIFYSKPNAPLPPAAIGDTVAQAPQAPEPENTLQADRMRAVDSTDHIRGDLNAPVKIVEYSDFECPFCKRFHETMNQVVDEYADSGKVAWVYRQFPLDQLHPVKATQEAVVSECVAELGGNDAFWQFADAFFEVTPSNNQTDLDSVLPRIISDIGLSQSAVDACVASGKYDQHVQDDVEEAIATGGRGTPWSIVVGPNGSALPLSGAQPYAAVKQLIEIALNE